MTLDEWKAQQEKSRPRNQFNIRKPGEGDTATSQWKKGTAYRKKLEEENEESDDDEEYEEVILEIYLGLLICWYLSVSPAIPIHIGPLVSHNFFIENFA